MASTKELARYAKKMNDRRQIILADEGVFSKLAGHLLENGYRRVFLICGKQTQKLKLFDSFVEELQSNGARCFVWAHSGQMATLAEIESCAYQCQQYNCEVIVSFGGGSVIDLGKMVAAWLKNTDRSLYQMRGIGRIKNPGLPHYAVSTTCSGAESSACAFVLADHQIFMYFSEHLIPTAVVLDPNLVLRLPMENMASASVLALTHAIEAFVNPLAGEFPAERANLLIALPIFFTYMEKSYKHGSGNDAYLQMMMAPYYSGVASRRLGYGMTHSLATYISYKYKVSAGRTCAILLPAILEYEFNEVKADLALLARTAHICSARATEEEAARAFISGFRSICRRVDMPEDLSFLKSEDMNEITRLALFDAETWDLPKRMTQKTAVSILKKVRYGEQSANGF